MALNDDNKLSARTAPQIVDRVHVLIAQLRSSALRFLGRKVKVEGIIGAVVLDFLEKPHAEQLALLSRRLPEVEALIVEATKPPPAPPNLPDRITAADKSGAETDVPRQSDPRRGKKRG